MFANSYQNGFFTEVWDSRVNPQKNASYKQLFKKIPSSMKNFYDKDVKSFIFQLEGNQRLSFPADDRQQLSLHQRYLVLQLFIPIGTNWSIELAFNDVSSNKKRINITTTSGKQQLKYFSFRYPLESGAIQKGIWMFLAIDIYSFCNAFKNTVFRSLDNIVVCSACKIRRLFTMKQWTEFEIPKNYWLPSTLPQTMQLIQFKQTKETSYSNATMINSVGQYSKLTESKVIENHPSALRNSEKNSPLQQKQKANLKGTIKLPGVNNRSKDLTPLKSSKLSQKIELASRNEVAKQFGILGKSNRSLTKADIIIEKSKIRLNSLQEKQDEIMNRLKSDDHRFSEKIPIKQTAKFLRGQNLFKSDLFKSQFSQSGITDSKISKLKNQSPKLIKMKKNFEEDNIFKEESYSSSYSRLTEKQSAQTFRNHIKTNQSQVKKPGVKINYQHSNEIQKMQQESMELIGKRSFIKNTKQSKISMNVKEREEIIEQDVWTDEEDDVKKPQTPIEQMIQSQQIIGVGPVQTTITRQNNKEIITKQPLNSLKSPNELQLIYDEMIGCYYHPESNTYYEIKK